MWSKAFGIRSQFSAEKKNCTLSKIELPPPWILKDFTDIIFSELIVLCPLRNIF